LFSGIKKGPRRPLSRIASVADGLPAPGDAPSKYHNKKSDNKIAHLHPAKLDCCVPYTPDGPIVKLFLMQRNKFLRHGAHRWRIRAFDPI